MACKAVGFFTMEKRKIGGVDLACHKICQWENLEAGIVRCSGILAKIYIYTKILNGKTTSATSTVTAAGL